MASHGVPRGTVKEDRTAESRAKELKEISEYQHAVEEVNEKITAREYTPEVLQKTAEILKKNPEYYTFWNHRRRIYSQEFEDLKAAVSRDEKSEADKDNEVLDIIHLDLQFLFPLLLKFPKCYWIWNHRLWLLEQSSLLLPKNQAEKLWQDELGLVGKMLSRDSRNFHGWGYRRTVIKALEELRGKSMTRGEYEYTTRMIGSNLSNFSAWHNRTRLIVVILNEEKATDEERRAMLDEEELKLIHKALFDPYDQSLWFYHQNLLCTFDPSRAQNTMAPHLSNAERLQYLQSEMDFIDEVLEDADDCKWAHQALIECTVLAGKNKGGLDSEEKDNVRVWIKKLVHLDPLRAGRWTDLEKTLAEKGV